MEWRNIAGFPNYQISDTGLIRNKQNGCNIINPSIVKGKYKTISLYHRGERKTTTLRKLYSETFGVSSGDAKRVIYEGFQRDLEAKKNIKRWLLMKIAECEQEEKNGINRHDEILYLREFLDELCMIPV